MVRNKVRLKVPMKDLLSVMRMTIHVANKLQVDRQAKVPPTINVVGSSALQDEDADGQVLAEVEYREISSGEEHLRPVIDEGTDRALRGTVDEREDPLQRHRRPDRDPTGQQLLGHIRSTRGPDAGFGEDRDD